jgi:hypothetical protein
MARNALEAVFGALGGGLVGYGKDKQNRYAQEQDAIDREERRKRTELADVLKAAEMVQSGSYGTESQLQARQQRAGLTAMQAALFAATAGKGPPSAAPMPTDVARAVPQLRRGMDAPSVSIGGQNLRLLETETDRARIAAAQAGMDRAARRTEGRQDAVFESGLAIERDAAGVKARQSGDERADRNDRTRRAAAEYLQRSKGGRILPGAFGAQSTIQPYTPDELKELRTEIYAAYGLNPSGSDLTDGVPTPVPPNESVFKRRRDEAIANVNARLISTAEKERLKNMIEDAYQADLAQLGTPR